MLVFVERVKPEGSERNPQRKARTNNKFNPRMALDQNLTQVTLVGGEQSHSFVVVFLTHSNTVGNLDKNIQLVNNKQMEKTISLCCSGPK